MCGYVDTHDKVKNTECFIEMKLWPGGVYWPDLPPSLHQPHQHVRATAAHADRLDQSILNFCIVLDLLHLYNVSTKMTNVWYAEDLLCKGKQQ